MLIFSSQMLNLYKLCPKAFYLKYVKNILMTSDNRFFEVGKKIHAIASYYLKGENVEKFEQALTIEEQEIWNTLKNCEYFKKEVVASEYSLMTKVDKYWISGRLDSLVKDKNNYCILDYKTGRLPENADDSFQTMIYLLCVDKLLKNQKIKYDTLKFVYLGVKKGKEQIVTLTEAKLKFFENKIVEICSKIEDDIELGTFKTTSCKPTCEYKKFCDRIIQMHEFKKQSQH